MRKARPDKPVPVPERHSSRIRGLPAHSPTVEAVLVTCVLEIEHEDKGLAKTEGKRDRGHLATRDAAGEQKPDQNPLRDLFLQCGL